MTHKRGRHRGSLARGAEADLHVRGLVRGDRCELVWRSKARAMQASVLDLARACRLPTDVPRWAYVLTGR